MTVPASVTDGSKTVNFDAISKFSWSRKPTQTMEEGDLDGNGVAESSGASLAICSFNYEIESSSTEDTLDLLKDLDDLVKNSNDVTQTLTFNFETKRGSRTLTVTGKPLKGFNGEFNPGDPDGLVGAFKFTVETGPTLGGP